MLSAILLGVLLGLRHACDPDHVIAVATISARLGRARGVGWIAIVWGIGHTLTILGVGAALVMLRLTIPPCIAIGMELGVGLVLIALGASNLAFLRREKKRTRAADSGCDDSDLGRFSVRALGVGLVHGLAGSAGVALLALAAMRTPSAALVYLIVFGAGTIVGMAVLSLGLAVPLAALGRVGLQRWLVAGSGGIALAFGLYVVYEITFIQAPL